MKKVLFLFSCLCFISNCWAQLGAGGSWTSTTRYGTSFEQYDYSESIRLHTHSYSTIIENVYLWYFYKRKVVGCAKDSLNKEFYFVIDEKTEENHIFSNKNDWQEHIVTNNLTPFYTRWHTKGWSRDLGYFWFWVLPSVLFGFFYIILALYWGFAAIYLESFPFKKITSTATYSFNFMMLNIFLGFCLLPHLFIWLRENYPSSI